MWRRRLHHRYREDKRWGAQGLSTGIRVVQELGSLISLVEKVRLCGIQSDTRAWGNQQETARVQNCSEEQVLTRELEAEEVAWPGQSHSSLSQLHISELSFHGQQVHPQAPLKLGPTYYSSWIPLSKKVCESPLCKSVPPLTHHLIPFWSSHVFYFILYLFHLIPSFWEYWPLCRIMENNLLFILTGG